MIARIVDSEGENPGESVNAGWTPLQPRREDHLGVTSRAESVAHREELLAQLAKVVELAVIRQSEEAVRGAHGLGVGSAQVESC